VSRLHIAVYSVLAILAGLSYWSIRSFVIAQEPSGEAIVVSNLTLNHVIFFLLAGAFSPWLAKKVFPKAPRWLFIPVALVLGVMIIVLLKLVGWETRW